MEFENVEASNYLGFFVSLQHGDLKEIIVKLAERRQRFASFRSFRRAKILVFPSNTSYTELLCYQCSDIALKRGP